MNGAEFKKIRFALQMTQTQLSSALGVSNQLVYSYESDRNPISKNTISKLMKLVEERGVDINNSILSESPMYRHYTYLSASDRAMVDSIILRLAGVSGAGSNETPPMDSNV